MTKQSLTIEQALRAFLTGIPEVDAVEKVPLIQAAGRILAEDVTAPFSVPSFPKAAMDGYAVRFAELLQATPETPAILRVIGESLAGESKGISQPAAHTAVRIMTGAEVPSGYDAVVREEDTDYGETEVRIFRGVTRYQNYCAVGEDIREGEKVILKGTRLGRIEIGTLASLGIPEIPVKRKLKIRILSTGSELMDVMEASRLPKGKIYNSIAYMLETSLFMAGFAADHVICPDEEEEIKKEIRGAVADVIITTGGVSVGKKDLIPVALESLGADTRFRKAHIQPGTPTMGSMFRGIPILSLSGNPYAAIANFDFYFWPLAARLTGCDAFLPKVEEAVLDTPYEKVNSSRRLLRAHAENGRVTLPAKSHASSVLSNLMNCNCYLDLPAGRSVKPGDTVTIRRMQF